MVRMKTFSRPICHIFVLAFLEIEMGEINALFSPIWQKYNPFMRKKIKQDTKSGVVVVKVIKTEVGKKKF